MRFLKRNKGEDDVQAVTAQEALAISRRKLEEAKDDWPEVSGVAYKMKLHRERNHFSEKLETLFREPR